MYVSMKNFSSRLVDSHCKVARSTVSFSDISYDVLTDVQDHHQVIRESQASMCSLYPHPNPFLLPYSCPRDSYRNPGQRRRREEGGGRGRRWEGEGMF